MLLEQVTLHRLGAIEADLLVERLRTARVGVAFDLEVRAVRIRLQLGHELVELGFRFVRQNRLA